MDPEQSTSTAEHESKAGWAIGQLGPWLKVSWGMVSFEDVIWDGEQKSLAATMTLV
jgi:hypothetical protein